ncbi:MAG: methyltransferase [Duncaniella sp.]|nr:methyltransferase [Duncaniella sp.]
MKVGTDGVLLGAWADVSGVSSVLDVGCGSGLIALMVAQRAKDASVTGVEIDSNACADAFDNILHSPWHERITVMNCDVAEFELQLKSPLLIISNPPFFTEQIHSPDSARSLARHGDEFGVKWLIMFSAQRLKLACDSLAFIAPAERDDEIEFELALNRLRVWRKLSVSSREGRAPFRTLWQVVKDGRDYIYPEISYLCIRNGENELTNEYINLTSEFYLDK